MSIRKEVKEQRGSCARSAVFHSRNDAAESKMTHQSLRFTIETAVDGREECSCRLVNAL